LTSFSEFSAKKNLPNGPKKKMKKRRATKIMMIWLLGWFWTWAWGWEKWKDKSNR